MNNHPLIGKKEYLVDFVKALIDFIRENIDISKNEDKNIIYARSISVGNSNFYSDYVHYLLEAQDYFNALSVLKRIAGQEEMTKYIEEKFINKNPLISYNIYLLENLNIKIYKNKYESVTIKFDFPIKDYFRNLNVFLKYNSDLISREDLAELRNMMLNNFIKALLKE